MWFLDWLVWSDAGNWEQFRTAWHDNGRLVATWIKGGPDQFVEVRRAAFEGGGPTCKIGERVLPSSASPILGHCPRAGFEGMAVDLVGAGER